RLDRDAGCRPARPPAAQGGGQVLEGDPGGGPGGTPQVVLGRTRAPGPGAGADQVTAHPAAHEERPLRRVEWGHDAPSLFVYVLRRAWRSYADFAERLMAVRSYVISPPPFAKGPAGPVGRAPATVGLVRHGFAQRTLPASGRPVADGAG